MLKVLIKIIILKYGLLSWVSIKVTGGNEEQLGFQLGDCSYIPLSVDVVSNHKFFVDLGSSSSLPRSVFKISKS
jgi:hypothetical protein